MPVVRHAPLSESQYKPIYNIYPSLQQELNRTQHPSQNQNQTSTIDIQIIHPRRKRKFITPRVHFNIPSPPTPKHFDLSSNTSKKKPSTLTTYLKTKHSDHTIGLLRKNPHIRQIRENPFNSLTSTQRLPYWMTQAFTQGEPNLVNDPKEISLVTSL